MALRISIDNKYNLPADYWLITKIEIDLRQKRAKAVIEGWTSRAEYLAGHHCVDRYLYEWHENHENDWPFGDGTGNLLRAAYDRIKTLEPFTLATEE